MQQVLALALSIFISFSAFAGPDNKVELNIESGDLTGMRIIETISQKDVFGLDLYQTRYATLEDLKSSLIDPKLYSPIEPFEINISI